MITAEINPEWIELAENLKFLEENRTKIANTEKEIDEMMKDESIEKSQIEAKVGEYRTLLQIQKTYNRDLLEKQGQKLFNKSENSNIQEVITLNRIDENISKVQTLKLLAK